MKLNRLFVTDLVLLVFFVLTGVSGFGMHASSHFGSHSVWHNWAVAHILATLGFVTAVALHVYMHWGWYKSLLNKPFGKKSKLTVVVTLLFVVLVVSGLLALIIPDGPLSHIGIFHYYVGIISLAIFAIHILLRLKILLKGLRPKR